MSVDCSSIEWSDSYLLGDCTIDKEHKQIFDLAKQILNCSGNEVEFTFAIKALIKYTKFHFVHEEQFMKSVNYKDLEAHKKLHRDMVNNLENLVKEKGSISSQELAEKLAFFVKDNIIAHILTEDKKVHHFIKNSQRLKSCFKWKKIYELQHVYIDKEHRKLFEIALKALNTPEANKKKYIRNILIELNKYMQEHFEHEEQFMRSIDYPDYERHKELHYKIIHQINDLIKSVPYLSICEFERQLIERMDIWLVNHIVVEDTKIMCYQNAQLKSQSSMAS